MAVSDKECMDFIERHPNWLRAEGSPRKGYRWAATNPLTNYEYETYATARDAVVAAIVEQRKKEGS